MEQRESWHLRKEVTIGNIFATVAAIAAIVGAFYNLDMRQTKTVLVVSYLQEELKKDREDEKEYRHDVRSNLRDIRNLLIKGLERSGK